jgi:hypothetical protein
MPRLFLLRGLFVFAFDGMKTAGVKVKKFVGLILGLGASWLLESDGGGLTVIGISGDEFHEVESDVFIAPRAGNGDGEICVHVASGERFNGHGSSFEFRVAGFEFKGKSLPRISRMDTVSTQHLALSI